MVSELGWVDWDLRCSPGWWAATVATYCPCRMVEHLNSKSTQPNCETTRITLYKQFHKSLINIAPNCSRTKDFRLEIGDTAVGPWKEIAEDQLPKASYVNELNDFDGYDTVPIKEIYFDKPNKGRFLQFRCITFYDSNCGLQYIGISDKAVAPSKTNTTGERGKLGNPQVSSLLISNNQK